MPSDDAEPPDDLLPMAYQGFDSTAKLVDGGRFSPTWTFLRVINPGNNSSEADSINIYKYGVPNDDADAASLSSDTSRS